MRRPLVLAILLALAISATGVFVFHDYLWGTRSDARAAVRALEAGDLTKLEERLAVNRGHQRFAFFFTSELTPRELGDALGTVAGDSPAQPFKAGVDPQEYDLMLADLAGTISLATHGLDDLALPASWTSDFITATTDPQSLYGGHEGLFDQTGKAREKQDIANRSNLLLLLSRGYWSSDFLQAATTNYVAFDRAEGPDAWPTARPGTDARYAPAPTGVYLTDGILALVAALTANPYASEWAFADFATEDVKVEGSEYRIGEFTHFLMFEHRFPELDGESVGMLAALTALSSAIDSASWAMGPEWAESIDADSEIAGPARDAAVLRALAAEVNTENQCTWNPVDYGTCVIQIAKVVWQWIKQWGHLVLDVLTLATFAPPPFSIVGVAAAATNATWYAVDSDFAMAGLSLAAAVPGLAFTKIAKSMKVTAAGEIAAVQSSKVAAATAAFREGANPAAQRVVLRKPTQVEVFARAKTNKAGDYIDPNNRKLTIPREGPYDIGHKRGYEHRCFVARATRLGMTRAEVIEFANNPKFYQIEDPSSNRSHRHEGTECKI